MPTSTTEPTTTTLEVPGATLVYDVRAGTAASQPPLFLIGWPMGAAGFVTLSSHFGDWTVITYDPRNSERSRKDDATSTPTPNDHADDLHRVCREAARGPRLRRGVPPAGASRLDGRRPPSWGGRRVRWPGLVGLLM